MTRNVEIVVNFVKLNVECDVYADRRDRGDWWAEKSITVVDPDDDLTNLIQEASSTPPWAWYHHLMSEVEAKLVADMEGEREERRIS